MGTRLPLTGALGSGRLILFDNSVLVDAYEAGDGHARRVRDLVLDVIPVNRRFATELVLWQFAHGRAGANVLPAELRQKRLRWFRENRVRIWPHPPPKYTEMFARLLAAREVAVDLVDFSLAVQALASEEDRRGRFAIATSDESDFCWDDGIVVISDFFRSPPTCS
jgi:hypothetical protein